MCTSHKAIFKTCRITKLYFLDTDTSRQTEAANEIVDNKLTCLLVLW